MTKATRKHYDSDAEHMVVVTVTKYGEQHFDLKVRTFYGKTQKCDQGIGFDVINLSKSGVYDAAVFADKMVSGKTLDLFAQVMIDLNNIEG